jgi:hypothetical protein
MSADTTSVFYQVGQAVKAEIASSNQGLLNTAQTWVGTQTFADVIIATGKTITLTDHVDHGVLYSDTSGVLSTKTGFEYDASSDTLTVSNLSVTGTTTSVQTTNLEVKDNFIHVSKGASDGAYTKDSGLYFERGTGSTAQAFIWDESENEFVLGGLEGGGSTKSITFSGVSAQIGTAGSSNIIDVSVSGALSFTSPQSGGGTVTTPEKFYVFAGSGDNKTIEINGTSDNTYTNFSGQYGYFIFPLMNINNGQLYPNYAVILIAESGVALSSYDIADIKILDAGSGSIENPGFTVFSVTYSDGTSAVASDADAVAFSTGAYPLTTSATNAGQVSYTAGTYDVTMVLKGQLASEVNSFQISATSGGSSVTDWTGSATPFAWNTGTLSYIADSDSPYTTFQQLAIDASKLGYSATETAINGGYFLTGSFDGNQLEVSFNTTPGSSDYIGLAQGSSVVMPVPASGTADGPDADTATVTPGPLTVGELKLNQQNLGDYADFTAGLNA